MRRSAKVDRNQSEIVAALRSAGCSVQILSSVGHGCPDLLVGLAGKNYLLECKDGNKPPSSRKLTEDQVNWFGVWRGQVCVVKDVKEALSAVGLM